MFEDFATHCIKWFLFRIYNETRHNNAILIKTKNVVAASDVATRIDLIKNKETKAEKTSVSMNIIVDNEINSSKFKRKQNDWWHLKDMNM